SNHEQPNPPPGPANTRAMLWSHANPRANRGFPRQRPQIPRPTSPHGKKISSQNALKHGLLSCNATAIAGKDLARYRKRRNALIRDYAPSTPRETFLVDELAFSLWHRRRAVALYTEAMTAEMRRQEIEIPALAEKSATARAALAHRHLCDNSRILQILYRYETHFQVRLDRVLPQLGTLAQKRRMRNEPGPSLTSATAA
ncbi:MAG: hypothetical protein M3N54_14255, partial [Acidobacteriota bacterium]|nr:hypothetical protein [Acidobacteriota bacterium]